MANVAYINKNVIADGTEHPERHNAHKRIMRGIESAGFTVRPYNSLQGSLDSVILNAPDALVTHIPPDMPLHGDTAEEIYSQSIHALKAFRECVPGARIILFTGTDSSVHGVFKRDGLADEVVERPMGGYTHVDETHAILLALRRQLG